MSGLDKIVAQNVEYDNTVSGMTADDVQEAIDEIGAASITINAKVQYFANLPAAASHSGETYYVEEYSSNAGVDYLSGLYLSNGTSWTFRDDKVVYSLNAFTGTNKILKTNDTNKEIVETLVEIDSNNNLDLKSGGLKDSNAITAIKLSDSSNTALNTTNKTILGGINENKSNIDLRALDSAVVHKTGDETIAGIKTFSNFPITPSSAPTTDYQVANKKYVDGNIDRNFIYGFIPKTNVTTPDENIDITAGKALCKDLTTFVELTADETALSMPELLGSALGNSTTYHLFRYKKNDDTDQWCLSTSETPTIADIKSSNAYRRVFSFITASDGNLIPFNPIDKMGKLCIRYSSDVVDYYGDPSNTVIITFTVPAITTYVINVLFNYRAYSTSTELWGFVDKTSTYVDQLVIETHCRRASSQITECVTSDKTVSLVKLSGTSLANISINTFGYDDYRLNY